MPFTFTPQRIADVILITPKIFSDTRGLFAESFKESDFQNAGLPTCFVQDNYSVSHKNVIRGLHYQTPPSAQGKLVRVCQGTVWDVAVDIRAQSPTFRQWVAAELNHENQAMLYIPPGFAHGFAALSDTVHLLYKCTCEYDPAAEAGIRWNDPDLAIDWPVADPILSARDQQLPFINQAEVFS
ncbi:MAG: dTDP-4-dehydrorhamnose 3,5-epimerase [Desulfosudaceae bacterium]